MQDKAASPLLPTYARADVAFVRGEGAWLEASDGSRYLDFGAGIAVCALGHSHPHLVDALKRQGEKLWHVSNLFRIPEAEDLGRRLVDATFADYVFFTNSGAEAVEGAIKTARKYHAASGHPERFRLVTFEGAFHGRTLATIAAGGNPKYIEGFGPKVEGFDPVPFGDIEAVKAAIGPETAGVLVEPIQGEGGVRVPPHGFLSALRELCDERGILLVLDEVQSGMGRTGKLFAHELSGVTPDIMAVAKGIGGGFPLGAFMATKEAGKGMVVGTHGTTYGGNPLAMSVGGAVLDVVLAPGFIDGVARKGLIFKQKLAALRDLYPGVIAEVRGEGLLLGLKLNVPNTDFTIAARAEHMLVIPAGENVVRLLPPLIIEEPEMNEAIARLEKTCRRVSGAAA
ncbi:MAG: aspartate aminotransferase family protein [Beijerinckiaceae bacterium]|nr:aspartate aminotransferase family protein [Beijerinckiaceae bacterium]